MTVEPARTPGRRGESAGGVAGAEGVVPTISVGIPLYNRRDLIAASIESVLAQTHAPCEIIVVDDGSTDGSGDVVAGLAERHASLRLVRQPNRGEGEARNRLLTEFRGDWLAFLDSDDLWLPGKLAAAAALIRADDSMEFVHSNRAHFWPDGRRDAGRVGVDDLRMADPRYLLEDWRTKISTLLLRRSLIDRLRPDWFGTARVCADYEFMWRAMVVATGIGYVPDVDTLILMSADGTSRATDEARHLRLNIDAMDSAIAWLRARGHADEAQVLEGRRVREWRSLVGLAFGAGAARGLSTAAQALRALPVADGLRAAVTGALTRR